jgi:type I restriction enzyme S subunit
MRSSESSAKLNALLVLVVDHRGKTPKKLGGDFTDAGVPVISAIHIKDGRINWDERERFVTHEMYERWMSVKLQKGDVLLTSEAPLGEVALVENDDPIVLSQRLFALRCNPETLEANYLKYFLTSVQGQNALNKRASGSTVVGIKQSELMEIEIPLLPLSAQRGIGEVLLNLDEKIRVNQDIASTLEEIAQTIFKSWFVDFDPVHAKSRGKQPVGMDAETAALFPDSFEDSELGPIPSGWSVKEISDAVKFVGGSTPSTSNPDFWNGEHAWTTPKDLSSQQGLITIDSVRKISDAGLAKITSGLLPPGSVLMSSRAPIGYLSVTDIPTAINQGFIGFPSHQTYHPLFILFWLRSNMDEIKNRSGGSSFAEISKSGFRTLPFLLPARILVDKFTELVDPMLSQLISLTYQTQILNEIRDALLPRLISGELEIPDEMLVS